MSKNEYIYGFHAIQAALESAPSTVRQLYVQQGRDDKRLKALLSLAERCGVSVVSLSRHDLDQRLGAQEAHQGVVALFHSGGVPTEATLKDLILTLERPVFLLVLDGVQDPHNLGACLRSANAFGVDAVIGPKRRAAALTASARKVACGAAELTPYVAVTNLSRTLAWLKKQGVWLVGLSGEADKPLCDIDLTGSIALVMGAEGEGLRRLTREHCDYTAKIPMCGDVASLNVSAATAISLYEAKRQR